MPATCAPQNNEGLGLLGGRTLLFSLIEGLFGVENHLYFGKAIVASLDRNFLVGKYLNIFFGPK